MSIITKHVTETVPTIEYVGVILDSSMEHEILAPQKPLVASIHFKNGRNIVLPNISEVHYKYETFASDRVAFESDIDGTGYTYEISDIRQIKIDIQ